MSANMRTVYFTVTHADLSRRGERVGQQHVWLRTHTKHTLEYVEWKQEPAIN